MSGVAHFFMGVGGSKIHERLAHFFIDIYNEKGELVNSMYIRKADFLKEDFHAYDNDISYGDI